MTGVQTCALPILNFLMAARSSLEELGKKKKTSLLKIRGVGDVMVTRIMDWQSVSLFSDEVGLVSPLIQEDVRCIIDLNQIIQKREDQLEEIASKSEEAKIIRSLPGFGQTCTAEIAGELGTVDRFAKEGSLALYFGMAALDKSSGVSRGSKTPQQVNRKGFRGEF